MGTLTEQAFARALGEVMQEKSFDKVTVAELVQRLNVNRQTFHYHYNDPYGLLEQICITDGGQMIGDNRVDDSWGKEMLVISHYTQENKTSACNTYYSVNRGYLEHSLCDRAYELVEPILREKELELTQEEPDFRSHFYKHGLVGLILDWINSGSQENP